jgi:hypothetical protein
MEHETIEIPFYEYGFLHNVATRIDRMLGGNPEPQKPTRAVYIAGRITYGRGYLTTEPGDHLELGVKLKEPVRCDITGAMLHGLIPLSQCHLTGRVEFCVDYMTLDTVASIL